MMNFLIRVLTTTSLTFSLISGPLMAHKGEKGEVGENEIVLKKNTPSILPYVPAVAEFKKVIQRSDLSKVEKKLKALLPDEFIGAESVDSSIVAAYQNQESWVLLGNLEEYENDILPDTFPNAAFLPLLEKLEKFVHDKAKTHASDKNFSRLLKEIRFLKDMGNLNPLEIFLLHQRVSLALSAIGEEEKDIFRHIPNSEIFFGPLKTASNSFSFFMGREEYKNKGFTLTDYSLVVDLSPQVQSDLISAVDKFLPARVLYPCLGQGKMGVPFLISSYLKNIFPIGFPNESLRAHGTLLSPHGFSSHDLFHEISDARTHNLLNYVLTKADEFCKKNGSIPEFLCIFPEVACAKYAILMNSLYNIYNGIIGNYLEDKNLPAFRAAMAGFFWVIHEYNNFPEKIYEAKSLSEVIEIITKTDDAEENLSKTIMDMDSPLQQEPVESRPYFQDPFSWESSEDVLRTCPLTGKSEMTDKEIYEWVIREMTLNDANCFKYNPNPFFEEAGIEKENVESWKVTRSKRFIDVTIMMKNGLELVYNFPTLYHKWENMDDSLSILQYAGLNIDKPKLNMDPDVKNLSSLTAREMAIETLKLVDGKIKELIGVFKKRALTIANSAPQGELSLEQQFSDQAQKLEKFVEEHLGVSFMESQNSTLPSELLIKE